MAFISLSYGDGAYFKSAVGMSSSEVARNGSPCPWPILSAGLFIVSDTSIDPRVKDIPEVKLQSGIRFYAGAPLAAPEGHTLGALCVLDRQPRVLSASQSDTLRTLAGLTSSQLGLRYKNKQLEQEVVKRQQSLDSMLASQKRFAQVLRSTNDGLWGWNLKTDKMHFCPRWKALLGYEDGEIGDISDEWFNRVHQQDIQSLRADIIAHLSGLTPRIQNEHRLLARDGAYYWVLCQGLALRDSDNEAYQIIGSLTNITGQKEAQKRLFHNAFHDVLTGLPNRALFMDRLKHSFDRAKQCEDYMFAVLFLDLDRFKVINDSLGHHRGDQLLVAIARRLEESLRPGDTIARLGGDEFAIILDHLKDVSDATSAAERIQKDLEEPFSLSGHEVFASASIGIALSTMPFDLPEDILRSADSAMYRAKDHGRACFKLFDKGMHARAVALMQLETDLHHALSRNELQIHYQPIISLQTWHISGFEALLRWKHPQRGLIPPLDFIPLAEETGLIVQIGQWVLREACNQLRAWQQEFPSDMPLSISVNLSGKQFSKPDLIESIHRVLIDTGIKGGSLKLEITESAIIKNIESAAAKLKQLKDLDIRVLLDDFGTGYSSLSYLHRFPIDTLKIDRSFVTRMNLSKNFEIVRTIVAFASNLGMDVIAEGVETCDQIVQLTNMGCDYVQGYLLSKPVDGDMARELLCETYKKGLGQYPAKVPPDSNESNPPPLPKKDLEMAGEKLADLLGRRGSETEIIPWCEPGRVEMDWHTSNGRAFTT
jgi:diguanylate cyclase (GGDEF)-like protein/PAS domain S-box-containing protein